MLQRRAVPAIFLIFAIIFTFTGRCAGGTVGLSKEEVKRLTSSFELDQSSRALMNAVTNNDLNDLALDRNFFNKHDDLFSFKVDTKGITNQKSSGRCWMFAGLNMMRPAVMEKFKLSSFEFSENYLFFWDKLEKANMFLETVIETSDRDIDDRELQALIADPVPDGGWWNYVVALVEKYGVVPQEVSQETKHTGSTRMMNAILNRMMRHDAAELRRLASEGAAPGDLRERKMEMMEEVYRILVLHMGVPTEEFVWRYQNKDEEIVEKKYTPLSFYKDAVGIDLADYVSVFDYPVHEYNKFYRINFCRNLAGMDDMGFINLGTEDMKKYAMQAVLDNEPVWFSADIGKENDREKGVLAVGLYDYESLLGIDHRLTKAELIQYHEGSPNHAMVFVGVDVQDNKPAKWLVENSWGTDRGNKGYWTMYDDWFDAYVFNVIIHKKHLPKKVLALLDTEPVRLPAWDPMRSAFDDPAPEREE